MFKWLKSLFGGGSSSPAPATPARTPETATPGTLSVMEVTDRFIQANPTRTPFGVSALIEAGATELGSSQEVMQACDRIAEHGCMYPLSPTVLREVSKHEMLEFLRWNAEQGVKRDAYRDENTIRAVIGRYRGKST